MRLVPVVLFAHPKSVRLASFIGALRYASKSLSRSLPGYICLHENLECDQGSKMEFAQVRRQTRQRERWGGGIFLLGAGRKMPWSPLWLFSKGSDCCPPPSPLGRFETPECHKLSKTIQSPDRVAPFPRSFPGYALVCVCVVLSLILVTVSRA